MRFFWGVLVVLLVAGCSAAGEVAVTSEVVSVDENYSANARVDSIVLPFRNALDEEMRQVVAHATHNYHKGRPNAALNNWSTDATLDAIFTDLPQDIPVFCLLNVGGLRNSINKGDVTLGDLYKLMPFDNEVVVVELPMEVITDIEAYLLSSGGEAIAGAKLVNGKVVFDHFTPLMNEAKSFKVLTSDYLMNGGDNMRFFEKRLSVEYPGKLLREVLIEQAKAQDTLSWNDEIRISF